jgi:DNA mismatch endonuclease, patch repair protein
LAILNRSALAVDNLTKDQRKFNMQRIRSVGTEPEKLIARELRKSHIKFSQHLKSLPGKPDFVFRKSKLIVFVDSDFWHGHPNRFIMPKTNELYWRKKIERNMERDSQVTKELRKSGWTVIRIWEYDIKKNLDKCVRKILKKIVPLSVAH